MTNSHDDFDDDQGPPSGNRATVYVVTVDDTKDLSDARRYGRLQGIFTRMRRPYNTDRVLTRAREALEDFQPGDALLMLGDPTLCAVCLSVVLEQHSVVNILQWDKLDFGYSTQRWDFSLPDVDFIPVD